MVDDCDEPFITPAADMRANTESRQRAEQHVDIGAVEQAEQVGSPEQSDASFAFATTPAATPRNDSLDGAFPEH